RLSGFAYDSGRRARRRSGRGRRRASRADVPHLPNAGRPHVPDSEPRTTGGSTEMSTAIADHAPSFRLRGVDGAEHTLESYDDADVLVLIQSCNHCPYVQAWEGRMKAIQGDYAGRAVRLVAINSNDSERYPEDSFEEMKRRASREGFNFDYLHDEDQAVGR